MSENIDQYFEDAQQDASSNFVEATREELLEEYQAPQQATAPQQEAAPQTDGTVAGQGQQPTNVTEDGGLLGSLGNAFNALRGGEGSGGDSNWAGSLMGDLRDQIDNTFQGDQLTREEITAKMDAKEQERNAARSANPVSATLDEVTGLVQGASVGAVEGALTSAELIGDTVKTFTGLAQESNNVFSNKYEWAKWDLGKDEVGAKTGVGKVAQGFAEFGIVMAATGGFGGAGAGAGLLKQIAVGAAKGVASDMILASKGEGNLSNLIKENAPEWYPSWLTALAVDEDDTPWEAILKTGLEGTGLGVIADAATGYVAGARAVRKAPKGSTPEQLEEIAVKAAQATLFHGTTNARATRIVKEGFTKGNRYTNIMGEGVYFATDERYAGMYGRNVLKGSDADLNILDLQGKSVNEFAEEAGIGRPAEHMDMDGNFYDTPEEIAQWEQMDVDDRMLSWSDDQRQAIQDYAKKNGIDGIKYDPSFENKLEGSAGTEVVIFDPAKADQVIAPKSSTGIFDSSNQLDTFTEVLSSRTTPESFEAVAPLVDQASKGIPVHYDDVANAFPEYFTIPGAGRVVPDDFSPIVYDQLAALKPDSGLSINPFTGEVPTSGNMVAIDGAVLETVDADTVANFIARNRDILSRDDVYLSGKISEETGKPAVELRRLVQDPEEAKMLGKVFDQEGVFDLDLAARTNYTEGLVPTGGVDHLRKTKGGHIGNASEVPNFSRSADNATKVYKQQQQLNGMRDVMPAGSTGRSVTDAQLTKIARSKGVRTAEVLREIADNNPIDINDLAKASKVTPDEIAQDAANAIADSFDVPREVIDFSKIRTQDVGADQLLTQTGIVQVRGLLQEMSNRIAESSIAIKKGAAAGDPSVSTHFDSLVDQTKSLLKIHKESANAYSRYLSTYKIKVPFLGKEIEIPNMRAQTGEEMSSSIEDAFKTLDDLKQAMRSGDPKAQSEAVRLATAMKLAGGDVTKTLSFAKNARNLMGQDILSIMYNSILSSPTTHLVNTLSNAVNTVYRPLTAMVGGDAIQKQRAIASFYSFRQNLQESAMIAGKVFKEGAAEPSSSKGFVQAGEVTENLKQLQLAAEATQDLGSKSAAGYASMLHDMANFPLFNWPSKLLTTSDEFFKAMVTRMEFQQRTMGDAITQAQASGSPLESVYKELLEKTRGQNFTKSGEVLNKDLIDVAKEVTFQTELEGWAKSFSDFANEVPPLRMFFPFIRTGHNILAYTGQHVPLLSRHMVESKAIMNGTDEYAKAVLKGRQAVGRYMVITAATAAYMGGITGSGPPDPAERKEWLKSNRPRSIRLPNGKFLDYSRIEPFGQILSAVADLMDMAKYAHKHGLGGDQIEYLAGYMTYAIAQNFTNKSYMQGVVPLGQILTPGWQGMSALQSVPLQQLNNFLPLSGARRAFSNAMTPYMNEYNNQVDRVWDQMTGGLLPIGAQAHDWLDGQAIDSPSGGLNALLPLKAVERRQSVVRDSLEDMAFDSSVVMQTLQGVKLDAAQKSRLSQLMGEGGYLEAELKKIVTAPTWIKAKDQYFADVRQNKAGDKRNAIFYQNVYDVIMEHRDAALITLKEEFPELQAQIHDNRILRNDQKVSPAYEAPDFENLVNMPN